VRQPCAGSARLHHRRVALLRRHVERRHSICRVGCHQPRHSPLKKFASSTTGAVALCSAASSPTVRLVVRACNLATATGHWIWIWI
jgi:hypothetical protein